MIMLKTMVCIAIASLLAAATSSAAADKGRTAVIYDGVPTEVTASSEPSKDLWIMMSDLKRATRFVVKPQGVCRDELCFPLPATRKAEFISKREDSLRESEETLYWLELLVDAGCVPSEKLDALRRECDELIAIVVTILKRSKDAPPIS